MIVTKISGGLGNQMFQYAMVLDLAKKHNTSFKIDISDYKNQDLRQYKLNLLNIEENIATEDEIRAAKKGNVRRYAEKLLPYYKRSIVRERYEFLFDKNIYKTKKNSYFDGYWQNPEYFSDSESKIRKQFTLKNVPSTLFSDTEKKTINNNSISIHIRRTDYITNKKNNTLYDICDFEYYQKAIELINEKVHDPQFFIFSDDILWVKNNFKLPPNSFFISDQVNNDYEELILMSKCKHNITANSTFSWWGAWLNNNPQKIVITPKIWFNDSSLNAEGLLPGSWIKIPKI